MIEFFKHTKPVMFVGGTVLMALGIVLLVYPAGSPPFITVGLGWLLLASGVVTFVNCKLKLLPVIGQVRLFLAITEVIVGLCVLIWPHVFVYVLHLILGIVIVLTGVANILVLSDAVQESKRRLGWILFILAFVTIILGFCVIVSSFMIPAALTVITGCSLIFDGTIQIASSVWLYFHGK